jgi:hypothetical protein
MEDHEQAVTERDRRQGESNGGKQPSSEGGDGGLALAEMTLFLVSLRPCDKLGWRRSGTTVPTSRHLSGLDALRTRYKVKPGIGSHRPLGPKRGSTHGQVSGMFKVPAEGFCFPRVEEH